VTDVARNRVELGLFRLELLCHLSEDTLEKCELKDKIDKSRSTIDRAIRDLVEKGFVEDNHGSFSTTLAGSLMLEQLDEIVMFADRMDEFDEALAPLTHDAAIEPTFLTRSNIISAEQKGTRCRVNRKLHQFIDQSDDLRLSLPTLNAVGTVEHLHEYVGSAGSLELVLTPSVIRLSESEAPGLIQAVSSESVSITRTDDLEFGIAVADNSSRAAILVCDAGLYSIIETRTESAVQWARERFHDQRAAGTEITTDCNSERL